METFLKTAVAILGLFILVPLSAWAATGRFDRAWEASKGFSMVMAIIIIPVSAISGILWLAGMVN